MAYFHDRSRDLVYTMMYSYPFDDFGTDRLQLKPMIWYHCTSASATFASYEESMDTTQRMVVLPTRDVLNEVCDELTRYSAVSVEW